MSDATAQASAAAAGGRARIRRHALVDRAFHWLTAACVIVLMATAFLPVLGVQFAWVRIHWITGLALTALTLFHIVRACVSQSLASMWIGKADWRELRGTLGVALRRPGAAEVRPGKYSLAQKLIHHAFGVVVLTAVATGLVMLAKVDTPWWSRDPYWLSDRSWGIVYVLHGLSALLLITMVMAHVYFALRPEKLLYTRSMILGWITRAEHAEHHDPQRWKIDP